MSRIFPFLATAVITIAITTCVTSLNANGQSSEDKAVSSTIQADVYKIFQSSCIDCHAKGGKSMAMSHVNFSEWDSYPAEKKAVKASDIVKILQKGKMPPKLYRESHPESVLTPAQIETVTKWAESLPKNS
jgi:mono/diheme cytochrome c family protein